MKLSPCFKSILMLFAILLITSCSNDDVGNQVTISNILNVEVDGEAFESINENVGGNENCDKLFVSTFYRDPDIQFRLNFTISTTGQLLGVNYDELILPLPSSNNYFLTPNFNPVSSFEISNFYYDTLSGELRFDFNGTVYFEQDNTIKRELQGNVSIESFSSIDCSVEKNGILYFSDNLNLFSFDYIRSRFFDNTQRHRYFSNNGYILDLNVNEDLWNFPFGTMAFDENSMINNVLFRKQLGDVIANQTQIIDDHPWLEYQTRGDIIIEEKIIENGFKKITGKLNLEIFDGNEFLQILNDIAFSAGSFEN